MAKKVAILAVNPVNGYGLFNYLEHFFENDIPYTVFAVANDVNIKTNSGILIQADDVVANLKSRIGQFDALVFACGDAIPKLEENMDKRYTKDMLDVIAEFGKQDKIMIGHCAAGFLFDQSGSATGKKLSAHPYVQSAIKDGIASGEQAFADGNFFTAETENSLHLIIDRIVEALK